MNRIEVQLRAGNPYRSGSALYLFINGDKRLQLSFNIEDYARAWGQFPLDAAEFAYFTSVIYGCDRAVNRDTPGGDRWTREFAVQIPVTDPEKWSAASDLLEHMLEFLTGDIWNLDFTTTPVPLFGREFRLRRRSFRRRIRLRGDAVMLYSGGLDSLIGVIDYLEENPTANLILASTYDAQAENSRTDQERLLPYLAGKYASRIQRCVARTGLCVCGEDTNFRSRSLSFIGNAILAASYIGNDAPVIIPENGAIALNYPLTPARRGSLSTRTVHPHFIITLENLLAVLGLRHALINPYMLKTKGEMMQECQYPALLLAAYADSASCGKRGHKEHWGDRHARQCGACVPCTFRRAAVRTVGYPAERYGYDLASRSVLRRILSQPNHDLSAIIDFIERNESADTVWQTLRASGQLNSSMKDQYTSLILRLREEVKGWAESVGLL